ncbi:helix-turn-helix domain-containing protein [Labedaea rhizosphaerae]|uniref:helix-turn-helix domain-containing protein n=1 Tax=Labedaea rhizosphaerae TaxID=598644 RepID=UPI003C7A0306
MSDSTDKRVASRRVLADPTVRAQVRQALRLQYEQEASVRELARSSGYAFGTVRTLLLEAGTVLRGRGRPEQGSHARNRTEPAYDPATDRTGGA